MNPIVDPQSLYGVPGAIFIESIVKYFVEQWEVPKKIAPLLAILFSFGWNLFLSALIIHASWQSSLVSGLLTAMVASTYHELSK